MGPFCHANAPHPVRPFPRGCSPPPVRYPRRAQRPGVRSLCPEEFLGTLCHPIATEGSPPRRSIHDSDREKLGNFDTKGGGKDKGIVSTRELFLSEWRRCAERQREREIPVSRLRSTCLRHLTRARDCFTTKEFECSPSLDETRSIFFSVPVEGTRNEQLTPCRRGGRGNASRIHVVSRIGAQPVEARAVGRTMTRG